MENFFFEKTSSVSSSSTGNVNKTNLSNSSSQQDIAVLQGKPKILGSSRVFLPVDGRRGKLWSGPSYGVV